jgi:hypothetical protein
MLSIRHPPHLSGQHIRLVITWCRDNNNRWAYQFLYLLSAFLVLPIFIYKKKKHWREREREYSQQQLYQPRDERENMELSTPYPTSKNSKLCDWLRTADGSGTDDPCPILYFGIVLPGYLRTE